MNHVVKSLTKKNIFIISLLVALLFALLPQSITRAATPLTRIKTCPGSPAYFCTSSGSVFSPSGMNYTQTKVMVWQTMDGLGNSTTSTVESHATLYVNNYNPTNVQNMLNQLANDGYKFIRVMIEPQGVGTEQNTSNTYYGIGGPRVIGANHFNGLYKPYLNNFIDLLSRANLKGIYVIPTLNYLPDNDYYYLGRSSKPQDANGNLYIDNVNLLYMTTAWIDKKKEYVTNFLTYIKNTNPDLLSTILAVDLQNEINVVTNAPPFTRTDVVPTADGGSYNMSIDSQRQQAVDANFVNWANQLIVAGKAVDPSALFTASVFTFHAIGLNNGPNGVHSASDPRYPARPDSLSNYSNLSYIDMHVSRLSHL